MDDNLISRCGIYCGACYVYRAFKDGGRLLDEMSQELGVSKEEIRCSGCVGPVDTLWRNCRLCQTRACLKDKGFEFCYECPDFEDFSCAGYERKRQACSRRGEDIREALLRFKAGDAENWLKEQDAKWRCANCRGRMWWEQETCFQCGQPISRR